MRKLSGESVISEDSDQTLDPASTLHKSTAGHCWPVSYPYGPIMARYRFM